MGDVNHEQVNLMLRLYDIRREPRLREAREWYVNHFRPASAEELMKTCPPGSQENTFMRMVLSYWEMVASIVNRGLIDEDFFFENTGEQWAVFEQVKPVLSAWRAMFANPQFLGRLEEQCKRLEAWREKRNPGSVEATRKMIAQMQPTMQAQKTQTASD